MVLWRRKTNNYFEQSNKKREGIELFESLCANNKGQKKIKSTLQPEINILILLNQIE